MNPNKDLDSHLTKGAEKLKVLHIGNIANNGYNIANLFNQAGVESDLIIGPYYHIAGCPEWEDAEFDGDVGDQFYPAWHEVNITNGFKRPKWAAQGPWEACITYHLNRNKGHRVRAVLWWWWLYLCRRVVALEHPVAKKLSNGLGSPHKLIYLFFYKLKILSWGFGYTLYLFREFLFRILKSILKSNSVTIPLFYRLRDYRRRKKKQLVKVTSIDSHAGQAALADKPANNDSSTFSSGELDAHKALAEVFKPLFEYYDVIVGYSTDGIWPKLAGHKYIAYEHGTIRTLPFEDSLAGRLCKYVYQEADAVIVSNFDNNHAADKLALKNYTCIPHYINEMNVAPNVGQSIRDHYRAEYGANFIIYNPSRQHWSYQRDEGWEKGNDLFIRGFAQFVKDTCPNAIAIMTHWGASLNESKELIKQLGIENNVDWVEPVPHKRMIQYIHASHLVSDQFLLGTFGGIPAKAFMHGRPVLSSFDPKLHEWCFSEMPPFLPARTVTEIVTSLEKSYLDEVFYTETAKKSAKWYEKEHSNQVLLSRMSKVMVEIIK